MGIVTALVCAYFCYDSPGDHPTISAGEKAYIQDGKPTISSNKCVSSVVVYYIYNIYIYFMIIYFFYKYTYYTHIVESGVVWPYYYITCYSTIL